jgi:hypothetical protein
MNYMPVSEFLSFLASGHPAKHTDARRNFEDEVIQLGHVGV